MLVHPPLPLDAHGQVLGHEPSLNGLNADCLQVGGKGSQLGIVWGGVGWGGVVGGMGTTSVVQLGEVWSNHCS